MAGEDVDLIIGSAGHQGQRDYLVQDKDKGHRIHDECVYALDVNRELSYCTDKRPICLRQRSQSGGGGYCEWVSGRICPQDLFLANKIWSFEHFENKNICTYIIKITIKEYYTTYQYETMNSVY